MFKMSTCGVAVLLAGLVSCSNCRTPVGRGEGDHDPAQAGFPRARISTLRSLDVQVDSVARGRRRESIGDTAGQRGDILAVNHVHAARDDRGSEA